jgi:hypothetical protein
MFHLIQLLQGAEDKGILILLLSPERLLSLLHGLFSFNTSHHYEMSSI